MDTKLSLAILFLAHVTGNDVSKRADTINHLTSVTNHLSSQVTSLTGQVESLKADVAKKAAYITTLTDRLAHDEATAHNLSNTVASRGRQLDVLEPYCRNQVASLTTRMTALETGVAFTAHFDADSVVNQTVSVGHNNYLQFDIVQYQVGGTNYNKTTGLFTAPSSGSYLFFVTLQRSDPQANDCVEASIYRNLNIHLATASACPTGYTTASNMALTWLNKGDKVHVQTSDETRIFGYVHTTFSGLKISPH